MQALFSIEKWCLRVGGGIRKVLLVDPNDLVAQPTWGEIPSVAALSFKPGKSAYLLRHSLRTARLESDTSVSDTPGDITSYTLSLVLKPVREEVEIIRYRLLNRRIHIVVRYQDDYQQLLPFARLRAKSDSGARPTDRNGYNFTATCKVFHAAPTLIAVPPVAGQNPSTQTPVVCDASVEPVLITVTSSSFSYNVPAGKWLLGWEMVSTSAQNPSLGLSAGQNDLGGPVSLAALQEWVGQGNMVPSFLPYTLHFSGMAGTNTIKIWLLA